MIDVFSIITIVGIVQGLFILLLILFKGKASESTKYIIALLVVFILDLSSFYFIRSGLVSQNGFSIGIGEATIFLYGPVLYLYVYSILGLERRKWYQNIVHFIPAVCVYLLTSPFFFSQQTYSKLSAWEEHFPSLIGDYSFGDLLFDHIVWYLFSIIYFVACLFLLRRFGLDELKHYQSNESVRKVHVRWLKYLIRGYLAFPVIGFCVLIYNLSTSSQADSFSILNIFMVFHVFSISYIGFTNQEILTNPRGMLKYKSSNMDLNMKDEHINKLRAYFESERPYLNEELTLGMVASDLNLNKNRISQAINEHFGYGFNDFVNSYRINLAKEYILAPEKQIYTIEAIASEVGFRSKPTFNSAFKKKEGITPSEYRKSAEKTM
ncbi:helix-turn-helix transcriptional regulator [Fulvivirga sp.]|uniref:helix-turn-helix domain-containing protein n=1 Tax=Fulvivirga sp. TaxID=1931237 RepID=UPI0032ED2C00